MSVCSYGFFNRKVGEDDIIKVIQDNWDRFAKIYVFNMGVEISFSYSQESKEYRRLWIYNRYPFDNIRYYFEVKEEHTIINFGAFGHSEEIIKKLLKSFGGGIFVPNDGDMDKYEIVQGEV